MVNEILPIRYQLLLREALSVIKNKHEQDILTKFGIKLASAVWQTWLADRSPEDNSQAHEFIVLVNALTIAEDLGFDLSQKRIVCAFSFCHDSFPIKRIMEQDLRQADMVEKAKLIQALNKQRLEHMRGGAANARELLARLSLDSEPDSLAMSADEIALCSAIIEHHDGWKLNPPQVFPSNDKLALCCLEADVLWPLHPLGVQADLERSQSKGKRVDIFSPSSWQEQALQNQTSLKLARPIWNQISQSDFIDNESIFRTNAAFAIYKKWSEFWHLRA